ncbi:MAG: RICIN domain-containing protein [Aquabacterium sp.]|nr:RICIN domain-containing protein [Aquabacterium sp.]
MWRRCRGDTCLTPKGFTFQRLMVGQGAYVDMYNLHTQAGSSGNDIAVRRDNMQQLAEFINWRSPGNAVIVAGDTNMRYTRAGENIREFLGMTGLRDTFVQAVRGYVAPAEGPDNVCAKGSETNECEVVDKIFYRGGLDLDLWMEGYSNEDRNFLDSAGRPLSDHRPIAAWFGWRQKETKFALVAQHSGKCVDVAGKWQAAGAAFSQFDCAIDVFRGNQLLRQVGDTLRVTHTGMCLEVEGASQQQGARVVQWPCWGGANQRVRLEGERIVFQHSGQCLNVAGANGNNGAALVQWPCVGAANERFTRRY